jgi:hypothetical protein
MRRLAAAHRLKKPLRSRLGLIGAVTAAVVVGATVPISAFATAANHATAERTSTTAQQTVAQRWTTSAATLFGSAKPASAHTDPETSSVELGTTFTASAAGQVVGVRYFKTAESTGAHVGNLWDSNGKRLATATFTSESASGWQSVLFAKPVTIVPGQHYVASYLAPAGHYATTIGFVPPASASNFLSTPPVSGVYSYGKTSSFPTKTWQNSGYWADVLFVPAKGTSTTTSGTGGTGAQPTTAPTPSPTTKPAPAPIPSPTTKPAPAPTPTTAPTPTPTTPPAGGSASTSFGGPGNTGPAAGGFNPTTKYTGPMTITTAGTVIQNQIIPPGLRVDAPNVTIQGNLVSGPTSSGPADVPLIYATGNATGIKVQYNELRGNSASTWQGNDPVNGIKLVPNNATFSYNNMYWVAGDGVSLYGSNFTGIGNWVHDFAVRTDGAHYDAFHYPTPSGTGFHDILIRNNRIEMWINNAGASGMTAVVGLPDGTITNGVVDHNLLAGGNYTIYGGNGVAFTNNLFWTKFSPKVGLYGTIAWLNQAGAFSGNAYTDDGVHATTPLTSY